MSFVRGRASVVCLCLLLVYPPALLPDEDSPQVLARRARKAQSAGDFMGAYLLYAQAAAAEPNNKQYWALSQALRTRALQSKAGLPLLSAQTGIPPASATPDAVEEEKIAFDDLVEARRPLPPKELTVPEGRRDFDLRGDAKSLFTSVLKAYGLEVVFDADYQGGQQVRFQLKDVDFRTTMAALQAATSSFVVPLSDRVAMIYKDTQQKRNEGEPTVAVALSLPNPVSVQEAQELARAVQQVVEIQKFAIDGAQRLVLIKDRVSKVRIAQALYQQMLTFRSQVMIDVELLDMQESNELNYGAILPTTSAMTALGRSVVNGVAGGGGRPFFRILPNFVPGFTKFLMFGGGLTTVAFAISDASLFANSTKSRSMSLFRTELRSVDGQPASIHIGDKYPIVTQQFQGSSGISALATPSTFQFEDLGLTLKITPRVHNSEDISMQVEAEFKVLGNGRYNGIPVISNRKFSGVVRMKNGESGVMAGLISATEARSVSGLPLLSQLPLLSSALAQNTRSKQQGEALVVITPRIIDATSTEHPTRSLYTGTEGRWMTLY